MLHYRERIAGLSRGCLLVALVFVVFSSVAQERPRFMIGSIAGRWTDGQAVLSWDATSDFETVAFRVFRLDRKGETLVNPEPIPLDFFSPGASYRVIDPAQLEGSRARYRIERQDISGAWVPLGDWEVVFEAEPEPVVLSSIARAEPLFQPLADEPLVAPALKIPVLSNDFYAVSFAAVADGLGWSEAAVSNAVVSLDLAMRCGDTPVAYLSDTNQNRIVFYGWGSENKYTRTNFFWIEPGSGLAIQRMAPDNESVSSNLTFTSTVRFKSDWNTLVNREQSTVPDDFYFTDFFNGTTTKNFAVPLEGYAEGDVTFLPYLLGWSGGPHRAEFLLNGTKIGWVEFTKPETLTPAVTAESALVAASNNLFGIRGVISHSGFLLGHFDTVYERYYAPAEGLLLADDGGHGRLGAPRFSDPMVFDITNRYQPVWIADEDGNLSDDQSWVAGVGTQWAFRERDRVVPLTPQPGGFGDWMKSGSNEIDYLIVAPKVFQAQAEDLAQYRAGQGLRTAVAWFDEICDQFAGGLRTPEAIREMLVYAHANWAVAPWMVLLAGRGHYDYLECIPHTSANHLPVLLYPAYTGSLAARDTLFSDLDGDGLPDLALGRLPAITPVEFDNYLVKLKAYEAAGEQSWHHRAVFVADKKDSGGDFTATNLLLGEQAQHRYTTEHISADSNTFTEVRIDLRAAFTNGSGVITYTGHGMFSSLGGRSREEVKDYLTVDSSQYNPVNTLINPSVPLFMALSCEVGRFFVPDSICLAEALVMRAGGGTLASFASAEWSYNFIAEMFALEFFRQHALDRSGAIGPLIERTRRSLIPLYRMNQCILFGDPALKLKGGEGGMPPQVESFAQWRWEAFTYAELADEQISGRLADPNETGWNNVTEYAFGGHPLASDGLRTRLEAVGTSQDLSQALVQWNQRRFATDLQYRLTVTTNLVTAGWEDLPQGTGITSEPHGDFMDRMEATLPLNGGPLFIRLEVVLEE